MNSQQEKVFITGGTGFIGSHLVNRLAAAGYEMTLLAREGSDFSSLPMEKINLHKGDLRDYKSLKEGMRGCEAVFHIAALVSDWGRKKDFYEVNVTGTQNLLNATRENGIKKLIFVSTTGVLGEEDSVMSKAEEARYKPKTGYFLSKFFESDMNHYRYTKMLAEKMAIEFAKRHSIDLIVIRPVWVYGPGEFHAGPYEFCKAVLAGRRILPMGLSNKFHVVYVKDLAMALQAALEKDLAGVYIFNVGNEEAPNIREYFNLFCKNLSIRPPLYGHSWLFYPSAVFLEMLAKLAKAKTPYLLTRARVKMFYCNNIYNVSKAKEILGFTAQTSLDTGIRETVDWWKENAYLQDNNHTDQQLRQKYITGAERLFLNLRMAASILFVYFMRFLKRDISLKQYVVFIKRILVFSRILNYNKAVRIGNVYKMHLYLPAFPTKAFYRTIDKFLILDQETIPSHVVFSMTKACGYNCSHCYQKKDDGDDLPLDKLIGVAKDIQDIGVGLIDIEGGEPLLRFGRLYSLIESLDNRSEVWINTTGHTLTYEKALQLKEAGLFGAMVSIHHWLPFEHDKFVSKERAYVIACTAIKIFHRVGINTIINYCPSLEMINDSGIRKIMELAKNLNASFVQVIHEKPAGGWFGKGNTIMDRQILKNLCNMHVEFNRSKRFEDYPSLSMQVFESSSQTFGCTAGGIERFYVNAHGEIQPCEFLNVSFGNVQEEEFIDIYKRMRNMFKKPGLNWLCNTECSSIVNYAEKNNITSLPLKKEASSRLIEQWDKGEDVPLYRRMRLCEKV